MSRTFRRKNFEQTQGRVDGFKTAGYFTEYDYGIAERGVGWYYTPLRSYREPNKEEVWHKRRYFHGDTGYHYFGNPGPYWKRNYNKRVRLVNERQIWKWFNNDEYEVIIYDKGHVSDRWDWD